MIHLTKAILQQPRSAIALLAFAGANIGGTARSCPGVWCRGLMASPEGGHRRSSGRGTGCPAWALAAETTRPAGGWRFWSAWRRRPTPISCARCWRSRPAADGAGARGGGRGAEGRARPTARRSGTATASGPGRRGRAGSAWRSRGCARAATCRAFSSRGARPRTAGSRAAAKALVAVIQEAHLHGVSTRAVDALVRAMGGGGVLCEPGGPALRRHRRARGGVPGAAHRGAMALSPARRDLPEGPRGWADRQPRRHRAVGVNLDGRREVLGVATGPSEAEVFWTGFPRGLAGCGLRAAGCAA